MDKIADQDPEKHTYYLFITFIIEGDDDTRKDDDEEYGWIAL
jgi:hypothetical protein